MTLAKANKTFTVQPSPTVVIYNYQNVIIVEATEKHFSRTNTVAYLKERQHRHLINIDCLSFVMCPLLAPVLIGFFSFSFSFSFAVAIYRTTEANKAGITCH